MTKDTCYNNDFTDADVARFCQPEPLATHPQHRYYPCGWTTGQAICSSLLQGSEFSDHLRSHHGVVGSDRTSVICHWVGCLAEMRKESLMRHVNEKHLELRYPCPYCPEQFTRPHIMQTHITRKHSGN